ncbi:MAG: HlyD family secretion protein [Spirochaetales bacterium]|nr:HlyD family secretion protein [Spirochaetales bacterium]
MKDKDRKRPFFIGLAVLLILVAVGILFGYIWIVETINYASTDDAAIDGDHVNISAKMPGRIKSLLLSEGDTVEKGQLLVLLDDADLRAQEKQAEASLEYSKQNLLLAKVGLDNAGDDFDRIKVLFASGAATKEQNDHAAKAFDMARAQYAIAEAQINTAKAQLGIIQTQLLNTRITSPMSGVIAKQTSMPGDVVQSGQTIFSINNLSDLWVIANFEETKIRKIHVDAWVEISIDAYPELHCTGRVARISAGIVPPPFSIGEFTKTTQRIPVKIVFDRIPETRFLLPGMSVEVKVKI